MKLCVAIPSLLILFCLNSCWVQEAPRDVKRELRVVSDRLTEKDSLLIHDYEKRFKTKVSIRILPADSIVARFNAQKYNSGADVLLTENELLRKRLRNAGAFQRLENGLFGKTERQFYESEQLWLGLSHNPLVLVRSKDTSGNCKAVNWQDWHRKDSLRPQLRLGNEQLHYYSQLDEHFHFITDKKNRFAPGETIYTLAKIVSYQESDDSLSPLPGDACMSYLVHKKRYITVITTASVFRYSPNLRTAEHFLRFLNASAWSVASGRNQLPVNREIQPNWYIQHLKVQ